MLQNTGTPAVKKAVNVIYSMSADDRIREQARLREKVLHDEASALKGARNEGILIGEARGEARGRMEGLKQGKLNILDQLLSAGIITPEQAKQFANA